MILIPPTLPRAADDLAAMLLDARSRSLTLMQDILNLRELGPKLAVVNPPLWELGHVGFFHDCFALRKLYNLPNYQLNAAEALFDSSTISHADRWHLQLESKDTILEYVERVQREMINRLPDSGTASVGQSYVYQLTTLHEDMHGEAFIYTRQTLGDPSPALGVAGADLGQPEETFGPLPGDVSIPGGSHLLGSDESVPFRFDNEKPPLKVEVAPFSIARAPVTNAEFAAFVNDNGYEQQKYWSRAGWQWRLSEAATAPIYWRRGEGGAWEERSFNHWQPLPPHQPVAHVSFYEAEAWCAWAGRRLPTEAEWEVAASRAPGADSTLQEVDKRRYPWGAAVPTATHTNLEGSRLGRLDVAALPEGDSAFGCRQMLGNVWEWTSSVFAPFPGFSPDLYRDYSAPWFEEGRRVLRGGAWATRARLAHNGYRNFFTPERRDIIAGFRTCAL